MTNAGYSEGQPQSFYCSQTQDIINIPLRVDTVTGTTFILWNDITQVFGNVKHVLSGNSAVIFLTDDEFNYLKPKRIKHYPGEMLNVVLENCDPVVEKLDIVVEKCNFAVEELDIAAANGNVAVSLLNLAGKVEQEVAIVDRPLSIVGPIETIGSPIETIGSSIERISLQEPSNLQEFHKIYTQRIEELFNSQRNQVASLKDALSVGTGLIQAGVHEYRESQIQINQGQHRLDRQLDEQDRLARQFAKCIKAVISQNYDYGEGISPRLFIVLRRPTLLNSDSSEYRLFFLCECGSHTKLVSSSSESHMVHLAAHIGYDIKRPREFIRKYGAYLLAMMHMIKHGHSSQHINVPSLEELDETSKNTIIECMEIDDDTTVANLVDDTIEHLITKEGIKSNEIDIQAMKRLDLKHLYQYLKTKDNLYCGNLQIFVTKNGHVKWVCLDHRPDKQKGPHMVIWKKAIDSNHGTYDAKNGRANVKVGEKADVMPFFEAMENFGGVNQLELAFGYNPSSADLRTSATAITKSKIVHLTIKGGNIKGTTMKFIHRHRFNPILQMMNSAMLQQLRIEDFEDFFRHMNSSSDVDAPQLRVLVIDSAINCGDARAAPVLANIIKNSPRLAELTLISKDPSQLIKHIVDDTKTILKLKYLKIEAIPELLKITLDFSRKDTEAPRVRVLIRAAKLGGTAIHQLSTIFLSYGAQIRELSTLKTDLMCQSYLAENLNTGTRGITELTKLRLDLGLMSFEAIQQITHVIDRSPKLESLIISVISSDNQVRLAVVKELLSRHGSKLTGLTLRCHSYRGLIKELSEVFGARRSLPNLESLQIHCNDGSILSDDCSFWIVAMACAPQPPERLSYPSISSSSSSSLSSSQDPSSQEPAKTVNATALCKPLKDLLVDSTLSGDCWQILIESIDFSALEILSFSHSNFGFKELDYLVKVMPDENNRTVPLRLINLQFTGVCDGLEFREMIERLGRKSSCHVKLN